MKTSQPATNMDLHISLTKPQMRQFLINKNINPRGLSTKKMVKVIISFNEHDKSMSGYATHRDYDINTA